ncbi:MAG TPA: hypothetical protein VLG47_03865 [Candidatus Saccharimonadales bacterium]|nr:hypothetical protein [Candidatus Saccharimonadales bacterium]
MTAQEYITAKLQSLSESEEIKHISSDSLEDTIYAKVMSKKFRKLKADDVAIKNAKTVIHNSVTSNEPITFYTLFGGNKLWRFDEAPEIDWAELFVVMYYVNYLRSVTSFYSPGAKFMFYSQNISVERLNNVPYSETESYTKSFNQLIDWLKQYLPNNIELTYHQHAEEYKNHVDYYAEIEAIKEKMLKESNGKLPVMSPEQHVATELNVRLKPGQSDDPMWREKVELEHQAIFKTRSLQKLFAEEEKSLISVSPTPYTGCIALGSTKKSLAKFWAGVGALERSDDKFTELVITPKQLAAAKFDWEDVNIDGLAGKNFSKIRVLK